MTKARMEELLNEVVGYLVELARTEEAIRILRNLGVSDYELVHDLGFSEKDVFNDED